MDVQQDQQLITGLIREYYASAAIAPYKTESREFGVGTFERKIMYRHLSFQNPSVLMSYLAEKGPPYVSYSSAYYSRPSSRPMETKGLIGSELVFDLDATDMRLPCQSIHGRSWVCSVCLDAVKAETIKLAEDFLIRDFGFLEKELEINFSGNRGYHIHIKKESVLKLGAAERKQISDYIAGNGLDIELLFPTMGQRGVRLIGPKPSDKGWKGRLARGTLSLLEKSPEELVSLGIERKEAANLHSKRALIAMGIKNGNWDMVYIKNKAAFWKLTLSKQAISQSDRIDGNVTNDPSHLIRLPDSIHGETGLSAKRINSLAELANYEPLDEAIAFSKGEVTVIAESRDEFTMKGSTFGPYHSERVELPSYAGVYLVLKGRAHFA